MSTQDSRLFLRPLLKALNHMNISELDLSECKINDERAKALAQVMLSNNSIYDLSLSKNPISNDGAKEIIKVLLTNRTLTDLRMEEILVTDTITPVIQDILN